MLKFSKHLGKAGAALIVIITITLLIILSFITLLANLGEKRPPLKGLAILSILGLNGIVLLNEMLEAGVSLLSEEEQQELIGATLSPANAIPSLIIVLVTVALACLMLWEPFRRWIAPLFPRPQAPRPSWQPEVIQHGEPIVPVDPITEVATRHEVQGFRPESIVHAWAASLILLIFGVQLSSFVQAGGLEGIAADIGVDYLSLALQFLLLVVVPVLGVGLFIRRGVPEVLARLGMRRLSLGGIAVSIGAAFLLLVMLYIVVGIWIAVVGEDTFMEQSEASEALAETIDSVGLAFAVAFTASVGEEIAFRGALQPIFGLWWTALIFTSIHIQYTLTPATLIIFLVALALGYIRRYYNTTAAIIVHFLYNLIQLLLGLAASSVTESSNAWLHWF